MTRGKTIGCGIAFDDSEENCPVMARNRPLSRGEIEEESDVCPTFPRKSSLLIRSFASRESCASCGNFKCDFQCTIYNYMCINQTLGNLHVQNGSNRTLDEKVGEEEDDFLQQIRTQVSHMILLDFQFFTQSKPTTLAGPTSMKVTAILEKASAIRQVSLSPPLG
ncbi:hypothetical protein L1987_08583 [Smallanthus sonchifolius]|uniref:Uncharacterized protein n=1 Tax=Smallanthus sonchifolius TaxID=185202 RepID=A0ACB9JLK9_9ASTR|nr:hypothetical protein L1987_08583 [Smallanthus sonchifolius]